MRERDLWCRSSHELRRDWLWRIYELHQWPIRCHHRVLDEEDDEWNFLIPVEKIGEDLFSSKLTPKTVHLCYSIAEVWSEFHLCISARCVQRDGPSFKKSETPQLMGDRWKLFAPMPPSRCSSPQSNQVWVAHHNILNFSDSDRELFLNPGLKHFLRALQTLKCSFCVSVFTIPGNMKSLLFNDLVRDWEDIHILSQEMPASVMNYSLIPTKKAFWSLHFRNCFAQLK